MLREDATDKYDIWVHYLYLAISLNSAVIIYQPAILWLAIFLIAQIGAITSGLLRISSESFCDFFPEIQDYDTVCDIHNHAHIVSTRIMQLTPSRRTGIG